MASTLNLGDELDVVIWKEGNDEGFPLGYPLKPSNYREKKIEVYNAQMGEVVRIRIERVSEKSVSGRSTKWFGPESEQWNLATELLSTDNLVDVKISQRVNKPRLMIRLKNDHQSAWKQQVSDTYRKIRDKP